MVLYEIAKRIINLFKRTKGEVDIVKNGEIKAVHYDDLTEFLKSIEEYEKVITGHASCYFCGKIVHLEDIQSIFPFDNQIQYCCNDESCYAKLIDRGNIDA